MTAIGDVEAVIFDPISSYFGYADLPRKIEVRGTVLGSRVWQSSLELRRLRFTHCISKGRRATITVLTPLLTMRSRRLNRASSVASSTAWRSRRWHALSTS